jgi:hypothetical protein
VIRTWLFPNGIGLFLAMWLIAVDLLWPSMPWHLTGRQSFSGTIGVPTVSASVLITEPTSDPNYFTVRFVRWFHWKLLAFIVLTAFLIAMPVGRLVSGGWGRSSDLSTRSLWDGPAAQFFQGVGVAGVLGLELGTVARFIGGDPYLTWLYAVGWTSWFVLLVAIPLIVVWLSVRRLREHCQASQRGFPVELA